MRSTRNIMKKMKARETRGNGRNEEIDRGREKEGRDIVDGNMREGGR